MSPVGDLSKSSRRGWDVHNLSKYSCRLFSSTKKETEIPEAEVMNKEGGQTRVSPTPVVSGDLKKHSFQAETRQLLDIVSNSLYTDKEVFLRELLSNASDALEKLRYKMNTGQIESKSEIPLEIRVHVDEEKGILTVEDTGIGMTAEEIIDNLGTIAKSGSKTFVKEANTNKSVEENRDMLGNIIGQFGVGFYSAYMVADKVDVYSHSCNGGEGVYWTSDGLGTYEVATASGTTRGTKLVLHIKESLKKEFGTKARIEEMIKKYSAYLNFPIKLDGKEIKSTGAIWSKKPKDVSAEEYKEFYNMLTHQTSYGSDTCYTFHSHFDTSEFSAQVLLYFPPSNVEKLGFQRYDPGINIYSRKVLVKKNAPEICHNWLRFVKGVVDVDSDQIKIHVSRENMQDSHLLSQLKETIASKVVDFLIRQAAKEPAKYTKWYDEFDIFIKEGIFTTNEEKKKQKLAKLLRFETSKTKANELISLDEYVQRLKDRTDLDEKYKQEIYFAATPTREVALRSPYLEAFEEKSLEVLFCNERMDDFIFQNLRTFENLRFCNIDSNDSVIAKEKAAHDSKSDSLTDTLTGEECKELCEWIKTTFPHQVSQVETTTRLKTHPAVLVDPQSQSMRFIMRTMKNFTLPPQKLQVNPKHEIVRGMYKLFKNKDHDPLKLTQAKVVAQQLIHNAFIAAGMIEDARDVLPDINNLMVALLGGNPDVSTLEKKVSEHKKNEEPDLSDTFNTVNDIPQSDTTNDKTDIVNDNTATPKKDEGTK